MHSSALFLFTVGALGCIEHKEKTMSEKIRVGMVGCGCISGAYIKGAGMFDVLDLVACADLDMDLARKTAEENGIPKACTYEEMLADDSVDMVLNLTTPQAHASLNKMALDAGKHVYVEKPFALSREDGKEVLELAKKKGLRVGCAPDTFLGAGIQTCRKILDDGWIGEPTAAVAFLACPGHEGWHPKPDFYYLKGGGPMLDMGPYYLTALVNLLGPVAEICGVTKKTHDTRYAMNGEGAPRPMGVEINTHQTACLRFVNGVAGTLITSFDVQKHNLPRIEIYGTQGTLVVPDPNTFGGPISLFQVNNKEKGWQEMPLITPYFENSRSIGAADMACAILNKRPHRVSGDLAHHVLDCMLAVDESSENSRYVKLESMVDRPAPLPLGVRHGMIGD